MAQIDRYIEVELENVILADWNYKVDDDQLIEKLKKNITNNGQIENILIRTLANGKHEVVNGNHRVVAMRELGMTTIVAYDLGDISLALAKRIAVETNETRFDVDEVLLSETMADILDVFNMSDIAESMPYSETEIHDLLDMKNFDFEGAESSSVEKDEDQIVIKGTKDQIQDIKESFRVDNKMDYHKFMEVFGSAK